MYGVNGEVEEAWLGAERREVRGQRRMAGLPRCWDCGEVISAGMYLPLPGGGYLCRGCVAAGMKVAVERIG